MIPEDLQDLAALYVLGSLNASEQAEFETALRNDAELRALVEDLRESTAALAHSAPDRQPPAALKQRILRDIAVEKTGDGLTTGLRSGFGSWLPWSIAALLMVFCGFLVYDRAQLYRELNQVRGRDPLNEMIFVATAPQKDAPPAATAVVAWKPNEQSGMIRISGLPAVPGKDYQLWAVDADYKDPVDAGIVHVDANGVASVRFKPTALTWHIKAFALSLEREGGVPKAEGPMVLVGATTG